MSISHLQIQILQVLLQLHVGVINLKVTHVGMQIFLSQQELNNSHLSWIHQRLSDNLISRMLKHLRIQHDTLHCWYLPTLTCITTLTMTVNTGICIVLGSYCNKQKHQHKPDRLEAAGPETSQLTSLNRKNTKPSTVQNEGSTNQNTDIHSQPVSQSMGWLCACWKVSSATCCGQCH